MQNERSGVLCVGSVMVDILCPVDAIPEPGQGVIAEGYRQALGGCAFNTANAVRLAGGKVRLIAPVGQGPYADYARKQLAERGLEPLLVSDAPDNGAAICLIQPDGERTMITLPGIERLSKPHWLQDVDTAGFGLVEVCGYEIDGIGGDEIIDFLEQHRELEPWFAPGPAISQIDAARIERFVALGANWHLNAAEVRAITGCDGLEEAGHAIASRTGSAIIVTDNARGSHAFERGKHVFVPSTPVKAVDSTGSGDSHLGALLAMRAKGADWEDALACANQMGAATCQIIGATLSDEQYARLIPGA